MSLAPGNWPLATAPNKTNPKSIWAIYGYSFLVNVHFCAKTNPSPSLPEPSMCISVHLWFQNEPMCQPGTPLDTATSAGTKRTQPPLDPSVAQPLCLATRDA